MPTYDYKCNACQHCFEEMQKITDEPLKTCPKCGQNNVQRLIGTSTTFVLTGPRWGRGGYA